ncbi:hypothetical protein KFK09_022283 [Dendrobium nobile]|uniref:Uncharacterized protein n=1 Tax=Dendrobium nobile TaxID=94219 RepID=A0A8T3AHG3_DENNO|nr:hypothetical protein KFK09_022283 [Dendrobium nobile]
MCKNQSLKKLFFPACMYVTALSLSNTAGMKRQSMHIFTFIPASKISFVSLTWICC